MAKKAKKAKRKSALSVKKSARKTRRKAKAK